MEGDLFSMAIDQSIKEWTELIHVIEVYGAGGRQASEKLSWMSGVLFDYFKSTPMEQLKYEISDYIEAIVENEFNFIAMDQSMDNLIRKLFEYHDLWSTGQLDKMKTIMDERKKINEIRAETLAKESKILDDSLKNMVLSNGQPSDAHQSTQSQESHSQVSSDINNMEEQQVSNGELTSQSETKSDSNEWMVVNNKRKKSKR